MTTPQHQQFRKACNRFSLIRSDLNEGDRVKVWCRATSDFEVFHLPPLPADECRCVLY